MANETKLNTLFQIKRGYLAKANVVLAYGEPGYDVETKVYKIGDGTTPWADLAYANKSEVDAAIAAAVAAQALVDAAQDAKIKNLEDTYAKAADLEELSGNFDKYVEETDAKIDDRYTKAEVDSAINTAKTDAISDAKTETETQIATFKSTVTDVIAADVADIESKLANVTNVMDFVGAGAAFPETAQKGDVFVVTEGDKAGREFVFDGTEWVEFGFATANENAISDLQGRMSTVEAGLAQEIIDRGNADTTLQNNIDTLAGTVTENKNAYDAYVAANDARVEALEGAVEALDDTYATDAELAAGVAEAKAYTDTEISDFNTETVAPIAARVKAIEDAPYATTGNVATAKQEAIDAAKNYADSLEHKNTTYTVAATENALEFTVTPSEGEAQKINLVAPVVDTGVMSVNAGTGIVVTPGEAGAVEVAHAAYETGEISKDPADSSATGDAYFMTGLTVDNGHVTGGAAKSLSSVLAGMTFIFDGGEVAAPEVEG